MPEPALILLIMRAEGAMVAIRTFVMCNEAQLSERSFEACASGKAASLALLNVNATETDCFE